MRLTLVLVLAPTATYVLTAMAAVVAPSPFGVGIADQGGGGLLPWIGQWQRSFYSDLTGALKAITSSGAAFWWLAGLSFGYGVIHAAGPGHGKIVISSYLLANDESARRGVMIAFLAAMVQAATAVLIVGVVALGLKATSLTMTSTQRVFELGSYALIIVLGVALLVRKVAGLVRMRSRSSADRGHAQHQSGCGHAHIPDAETASRVGSLSEAVTAVLSVGIRPCSGALIVLVFALSQGIFWAGIASTFLMGLGTALTIGVLAVLAVTAKDVAMRIAGSETARAGHILTGIEIAGAMAITALGLVLLGGALSA